MNTLLKSKIENAVRKDFEDFSVTTRILHLSTQEFTWLEKVSCSKYSDLGNLKVALFENSQDECSYLVVSSMLETTLELDDEAFVLSNTSTPMFMAVVKYLYLNILPSYSSASIKDLMYAEEFSDVQKNHFEGYELERITKLFEHIDIFTCPSRDYTNIDFLTIVSRIVLNNKDLCKLNFSDDTFSAFETALLGSVKNENLLCALNAYCWRYCFLDVYRCIEPLFPYPSISKLKDMLGASDLNVLKESVSSALAWKAKEEVAMNALFEDMDETKVSFLNKVSVKEGSGKKIYELRNRIVHHQDFDTDMEKALSKEEWDKLVCFLLENISNMYSKYVP